MRIFGWKKNVAYACVVVMAGGTASAQITGPSSSESPYVVPVAAGVQTVSILTVGDSVNLKPDGTPYRMVGIPDGLGAYSNGDGTFSLLMNHELVAAAGIPRAHGTPGAFVSSFKIQSNPLSPVVDSGADLIRTVAPVPGGSAPFSRFCSADLPEISAFFNEASGLGTRERLFMNGEEAGPEGRAFAHSITGDTFYLPRLGRFSWENSVANPGSGDSTIVIGTDDATPGQVYVYQGTKQAGGTLVDKAGLTNGSLYGIRVDGVAQENRTTGIGAVTKNFDLFNLGNVTGEPGAGIDTRSDMNAVTEFLRPEDIAWDPRSADTAYFVTTDRYDQVKDGVGPQVGRSRLWKLEFNDLGNIAAGGTIEMLLDGTEAHNMLDNIAVDQNGHILMQEDAGNVMHNSKIWLYDTADDSLELIAQHDVARFGDIGIAADPEFGMDEESSGIIDASEILGDGWFLIDVEAHSQLLSLADAPELVEGGQLLAIFIPQAVPEPSTLALAGLGVGFLFVARRKLAKRA